MKDGHLLKTNLYIISIIVCGFLLTAVLSYKANYQAFADNIENISALTAEGIYLKITKNLAVPIKISQTMAHDTLLIQYLADAGSKGHDEKYIAKIKEYLNAYKNKYNFDSVFLVAAESNNYYTFKGFDRHLTPDNEENIWYYKLLNSNNEYCLEVDNDESGGANNEITVFVNCKIVDKNNTVVGVIGVGVRMQSIKEMLAEYENAYNVVTSIIDYDGNIELSTTHNGYQKVSWFSQNGREALRDTILTQHDRSSSLKFWTEPTSNFDGENFFTVINYIPETPWILIIQNPNAVLQQMRNQFYVSCFVICVVLLTVLFVVAKVIRRLNDRVKKLVNEQYEFFKKATGKLYEAIDEFNISQNSIIEMSPKRYFDMDDEDSVTYDDVVNYLCKNSIHSECTHRFRDIFSRENLIKRYTNGEQHFTADFQFICANGTVGWGRIASFLFRVADDVCMICYHKNIDTEKQQERKAMQDEFTGFYTKVATEKSVDMLMSTPLQRVYALFMLDIDNFKHANDKFGHAFGDKCIYEFTSIMKQYFGENALYGRVGGDEFMVLAAVKHVAHAEHIAADLVTQLHREVRVGKARWAMSASIGVVMVSQGMDFQTLYSHADAALYQSKQRGKNCFTLYS